jgi:aquaglyceroporin related protein, other eukaryote
VFIFAQVLGAMCGAAIIYANYFHAIDLFEGGRGIRTLSTASLFATYAVSLNLPHFTLLDLLMTFKLPYMTSVSCFFSEFMATAVLLMVVMAITDKKNGPPPAGLVPLALFITILGIGASIGMETSYAINPARDFGPRVFTAMVYGKQVFTFRK